MHDGCPELGPETQASEDAGDVVEDFASTEGRAVGKNWDTKDVQVRKGAGSYRPSRPSMAEPTREDVPVQIRVAGLYKRESS